MSKDVRAHLPPAFVLTVSYLVIMFCPQALAQVLPDGNEITHKEEPVPAPAFGYPAGPPALSEPAIVEFNGYRSIQVNVDANGMNIGGDAANEPSIAVDPTNPTRMAIGWRQFDTIANSFRQAGNSYSSDGGETWNFRPVIEPGQFRSDPVLGADAEGNFYYYSLSTLASAELFKSTDGGATWGPPVTGTGGDKAWMAIDRTSGIGRGNVYAIWNIQFTCCSGKDFARFVDGGLRSTVGLPEPSMKWGTLDVGLDGTLYAAGSTLAGTSHLISWSFSVQDRNRTPTFINPVPVNLGGWTVAGAGPNPGGLAGQVWVATDHTDGPTSGNVYILGSVNPIGDDPLDVMFIRSTDGGWTWSTPVRVNDDPSISPSIGAYQWFGTMSVAPNGRIDVIWNDTRNHLPRVDTSELFYAWSIDAGETWSDNTQVSPPFNSREGWPQQNKLGDYYDMVSDNAGVSIAYAATFNGQIVGEQDVYFLRIGERDCNGNGVNDLDDIANETSLDCNANDIPDDCECDCNFTGQPDTCDLDDGISVDCNGNRLPDECDADFDGDKTIDDCDGDRDGDEVDNFLDLCDFTALGLAVDDFGCPIGSNFNRFIALINFRRFPGCLFGPHPQAELTPVHTCIRQYEFPTDDGEGDLHIDMKDFAEFQKAFGRVGISVIPDRCP